MLLTFIYGYWICALVFLLINGIVTGYNLKDWKDTDFVDAILWPLSLCIVIGSLIKLFKSKKK